jgi:hypothetical protein
MDDQTYSPDQFAMDSIRANNVILQIGPDNFCAPNVPVRVGQIIRTKWTLLNIRAMGLNDSVVVSVKIHNAKWKIGCEKISKFKWIRKRQLAKLKQKYNF